MTKKILQNFWKMLEFSNMKEYRMADNFLILTVGQFYEAREREREKERERERRERQRQRQKEIVVKNVCIVEISPQKLNLLNVVLSLMYIFAEWSR